MFNPLVSVVIPCFNEGRNIKESIEGVINQDLEENMEVIVVDDGSSDDTYSIARDYVKKNSIPKNRSIKILKKRNGGKPSALNLGIKEAKGKYCICSDGDTRLERSAVRLILEKFSSDPRLGSVAGMVHVKNQENTLTKLQEIEYLYDQYLYRFLQDEDGNVTVTPGCIFGIRTDLAKKYPSSDDTCVEDMDTTIQINKGGSKTGQEVKARCYTNVPTTWSDWWNQRKRWWYGAFQVWRKHKPWKMIWFSYSYPFGSVASLLASLMMCFAMLLCSFKVSFLMAFIIYWGFNSLLLTIVSGFFIVKSGESYLFSALPIYSTLYTQVCTFCRSYLYLRYLLGVGVSFRYGLKWVYVK